LRVGSVPWLQVGWPTSTLRFAAACSPRFSGIQGSPFFFVTSEALFCSAIHFAKACGKSVTVGTIKRRRDRGTRRIRPFVRAGSISAKRECACVKQCRCRSVPKSETARAAGSPAHCAGPFWGEPWWKKSGPDLSQLGCIITGLALFAADRFGSECVERIPRRCSSSLRALPPGRSYRRAACNACPTA
jgi:hypothetical protein